MPLSAPQKLWLEVFCDKFLIVNFHRLHARIHCDRYNFIGTYNLNLTRFFWIHLFSSLLTNLHRVKWIKVLDFWLVFDLVSKHNSSWTINCFIVLSTQHNWRNLMRIEICLALFISPENAYHFINHLISRFEIILLIIQKVFFGKTPIVYQISVDCHDFWIIIL